MVDSSPLIVTSSPPRPRRDPVLPGAALPGGGRAAVHPGGGVPGRRGEAGRPAPQHGELHQRGLPGGAARQHHRQPGGGDRPPGTLWRARCQRAQGRGDGGGRHGGGQSLLNYA